MKTMMVPSTYARVMQVLICCTFGMSIANARPKPTKPGSAMIVFDNAETQRMVRQGVQDLTRQKADSRDNEKKLILF